MKIEIENVVSLIAPENRANVTFLESHQIRGCLRVMFSHKGVHEKFELSDANIPLFFAELRHFIHEVNRTGKATWLMQFEPFLTGEQKGDSIEISDRAGAIVEIVNAVNLEEIYQFIERIQSKYGVLPTHHGG